MILNVNELSKTKTFQTNIFNGSKIISYDNGMNVIVITKLSEKVADVPFAVDNKGYDVIKKFKNPELSYDEEKNLLYVKQGKNKFKINTFKGNLPQTNLDDLKSIQVNYKALKKACKFTSISEARPILTAVCIKENGNIFATDSYVAYRWLKDTSNNDENVEEINVSKNFIEVVDSENEFIDIQYNANCIIYKNENITYVGRIINGVFPKLNKILELNSPNSLVYNYEELKEALSLASNVGKTKENNGNIIIRLKEKSLIAYGESQFESVLDATVPENLDITFSSDKIILLLSCVEKNKENIELNYNEGLSPVILSQDNEKIIITQINRYHED